MKETDLFEPVKRLLEESGYTVYSEVEGPGGRADVVGVHGAELVVVEMKTSLSLDLMEQGWHWANYAHRVYVAIHRPKRRHDFAERVLRKFGLGLIEVNFVEPKLLAMVRRTEPNYPAAEAKVGGWFTRPQWNRNISPDLRKALREEQRQGPPGGTKGGGYVTDYKLTMERVRHWLEYRTGKGEWATVSDILKEVETHYLTPKQSLAQALVTWEADWCEVKVEGGKRYFRVRKAG